MRLWCSYCGAHDHDVKFCPKTWDGQGNLNARRCSYCGSKDHDVEHCPKTWQGQINNRERV